MEQGYHTISLEKKGHLAVLTFNRPDRLNTFSLEMSSEFDKALDVLERDGEVRALLLTGAGKAFSAGQEMTAFETDGGALRKSLLHLKKPRLLHFGKPVIAAVNGAAMGAGADTVLMCDMVIASEKARFSFPGAKLGIVCPYALIRLCEEIGRARAKELMMTGRSFDAHEALAFGLINKVVVHERLMEEAVALGHEVAQAAPLAVQAIKEGVNRGLGGFTYSYETMVDLMSTEDRIEGTRAFFEKRAPEFKGR
jgi:enoyl-CoA hydratase/carnithine racemase